MKLLLQRALQAVLDLERLPVSCGPKVDNLMRQPPTSRIAPCRLPSRLGAIQLLVQTTPAGGSQLFRRYIACENHALMLLGRMIARGRASNGAARDFAQLLCERRIEEELLHELQARLSHELALFTERDLNRRPTAWASNSGMEERTYARSERLYHGWTKSRV